MVRAKVEKTDVEGMASSTTRATLTKRDRGSVLELMFLRGREKRSVIPRTAASSTFIDRDGTHFRNVQNWRRNGVVTPELEWMVYRELLREAEYYQLPGLVEAIPVLLVEDNGGCEKLAEMSRLDVTKCLQLGNVRMRGLNLSGQSLSKLDLSGLDFSHCRLVNTDFHTANLRNAEFSE